MNMKCRTTPKNNNCTTRDAEQDVAAVCEAFDVCLGAGRSLHFDGQCFRVDGSVTIPDGWYSQVQIVNGCIVDAKGADVSVYTPAPCAPAAGPCSDAGGSGGSSMPPLSPDACNLLANSGGQLLATLHVTQGTGVTVSGCGSQNDPLRISSSNSGDGGAVYLQSSTPSALGVTGSGTLQDAFQIGLKESPLAAGEHGAFTTDAYGRITAYNASAADDALTALAPGAGTEVEVITPGVARVNLTATGVKDGTYLLGGYTLGIDVNGRVVSAVQSVTVEAGTYTLGRYDVAVNATGSITGITQNADAEPLLKFVGVFRANAGDERVFSIETHRAAQFYIHYQGAFGTAQENGPRGMQFTDSIMQVVIDGTTMSGGMVQYEQSGNAATTTAPAEYHLLTGGVFAAGAHEIQFTMPNGTHNALVTVELVEGAS
ncbi:MAG: hypothetical protein E7G41_06270 [Bifidobacterium sp.]|nr:hypothetical protein [Bifidobacterium sp.]